MKKKKEESQSKEEEKLSLDASPFETEKKNIISVSCGNSALVRKEIDIIMAHENN